MFTTVKFRNFKSLKDFTIHLRTVNVLVGPNNAGKSTILDGFRVMMAAHAYASRRLPHAVRVKNKTITGYEIPQSQIPISLTNIHSDYQTDQETSATFTLANGNELKLEFHENARCILTIQSAKRTANTSHFKKNFPANIYTFPTLGPLEETEELLSDDYVRQSIGTRRAHRLFRNIWYRWSDEFPIFQNLIQQTWDGMTVSQPELAKTFPPTLSMFCTEDRVDRELFWAGFGFQVWLQILTHIANSAAADVLVIDEPEIYLHPDLQHKLFQLLKTTNKQIVLATHSAEMVNEAEHEEVILINKNKRNASRVTDIEGLQEALFSIGSAQNIHLARLSRGKRILFLEGNDARILKRIATKLNLLEFGNDTNTTIVPIGGFTQRQKIEHAAWTFKKVLKADIAVAALLDRDYRCQEEIEDLLTETNKTIENFYLLKGKEIENYLLAPFAILKAASERLKERKVKQTVSEEEIISILDTISDRIKSDVLAQYISNRMRYFSSRTSKDPATVAKEAIAQLDAQWSERSKRLMVVPGKQFLSDINSELQSRWGISITTTQIIRHINEDEIAPDLRTILVHLNNFSRNPTFPAEKSAA